MNIVVSLVVGILIGWGASVLKRTAGQEELVRNVAVGIVGGLLGSWLLGRLLEPANQGDFSFGAMIASALGAAVLVFAVDRLNRK